MINKKKLKTLFNTLSNMRKQDNKAQEVFHKLIETISPNTNNFFIYEKGMFEGAMGIIESVYDKHLVEHINYWFYDCDEGKNHLSGKIDDKEYKFDTLNKYIEFVVDYYNIVLGGK